MRTNIEMDYVMCKDRHITPAKDGPLFNEEITNPNDFEELYRRLEKRIPKDCKKINLYVTGLSQALTVTTKYCIEHQITLVAKHWDNACQMYFPNTIVQFEDCPCCGTRFMIGQQSRGHSMDVNFARVPAIYPMYNGVYPDPSDMTDTSNIK